MTELPGEPIEPLPRLLAQLAWRFALVAGLVVGIALTGRLTKLDFSVAAALGGLTAFVEGATRAARGRAPGIGSALLALSWPAAALWLVGCLLQGAYVNALAEAGPEAAWERMWQLMGHRDLQVLLGLCAVMSAGVPVLAFARSATPRLGGQVALAAVPAVVLGGGPAFVVLMLLGQGGPAMLVGLAGAIVALLTTIVGALILRGLDLLEARFAPPPACVDAEVG